MRSDSEIWICIFRSDKITGLIMQSDIAKSDGIKIWFDIPMGRVSKTADSYAIRFRDLYIYFSIWKKKSYYAVRYCKIRRGKIWLENPMARVVRLGP